MPKSKFTPRKLVVKDDGVGLITTADLAKAWGVQVPYIKCLVENLDLPMHQFGKTRAHSINQVNAWLDDCSYISAAPDEPGDQTDLEDAIGAKTQETVDESNDPAAAGAPAPTSALADALKANAAAAQAGAQAASA